MSFLGFIYFLIVALFIVLLFSLVFRVRGPWGSFWSFFLIILLSIMIADIWLKPLGPFWRDVYWVPPLIAGILVAFVLAAATPAGKKEGRISSSKDGKRREESPGVALGIFFWLTLVILVLLIIAGLLNTNAYPY